MRKRLLAVAGLFVALGIAQGAGAAPNQHKDDTAETNAQRCDTWARDVDDHGLNDHDADNDGASYDHTDGSDIEDVPGVEVHSHSGHHVARHESGYVEVVGGQSYHGPYPHGNQGGYVQGEVDPADADNDPDESGPDADFHANFFGPNLSDPVNGSITDPDNPLAAGRVCVAVNTTKAADTGQLEVP